jgi:hypothetical protein
MVTVNLQGREFDVVNFHDVDVMSYFPEGTPNVQGVVECLNDVFDEEEAQAILDKMTVEELLEVWEEWTRNSNFDFVYQRIYDVMRDDRDSRVRNTLALWASWTLTVVAVIVTVVLVVL